MRKRSLFAAAALSLGFAALPTQAQDLTAPGDPISSTPAGAYAAEPVQELIDNVFGGTDGDASTNKFFLGSGTVAIVVDASNDTGLLGSISLTSANDSPLRDPINVAVAGSATGAFAGEQTSIAGLTPIPAFSGREVTQTVDLTDATAAFDFYQITFNSAGAEFQLAELQLIAVPEPASLSLLALGGLALLARRRRA